MFNYTDKTRFLAKFKQGSPDECWEWKGAKITSGYGLAWAERKKITAHRLSYQIFKGEIPKSLCVCHACDNPLCVNPNHLWLGTHKDNMQDCFKKGKLNKSNKSKNKGQKCFFWDKHLNIGEKNNNAKLTEEQVRIIRSSNLKLKELAKIYETTTSAIWQVKKFKTWKHIK